MKRTDRYFHPVNMRMPIYIPMLGINYCHADYRNIRNPSGITVLGFVLAGQGTIQVDSLTFHPKKGDVFILPENSYHEIAADPLQEEEWTYIWYNVRGQSTWLLETFRLQSTFHIPDAPINDVFLKGIHLLQKEEMDNEALHINLVLICTEILANLAVILEQRSSLLSVTVQKMKQYLDELDKNEFRSASMSHHFAMSFKQINRLFKKEIGTTVYDYLISKKIRTAKMLLKDTEMSVSEISYQIGYNDSHHFSNVFRKKTGFSPTEYRRGKPPGTN
jgi:AraC family transcriptional regulator, arabinose operon regulatory protein